MTITLGSLRLVIGIHHGTDQYGTSDNLERSAERAAERPDTMDEAAVVSRAGGSGQRDTKSVKINFVPYRCKLVDPMHRDEGILERVQVRPRPAKDIPEIDGLGRRRMAGVGSERGTGWRIGPRNGAWKDLSDVFDNLQPMRARRCSRCGSSAFDFRRPERGAKVHVGQVPLGRWWVPR